MSLGWVNFMKPLVVISNIRFVIALHNSYYGAIFILSSVQIVRFICVLLLVRNTIISASSSNERSLLLQCYKLSIFRCASTLSSRIATAVVHGCNVMYISVLIMRKILAIADQCLIRCLGGLSLIFIGRIKGHMRSRSVTGIMCQLKAICIGSMTRNILDLSFSLSITSLGIVGVKVAVVN